MNHDFLTHSLMFIFITDKNIQMMYMDVKIQITSYQSKDGSSPWFYSNKKIVSSFPGVANKCFFPVSRDRLNE